MKVLLTKDVGGVGQHGTIKDVTDGYALNYLLPRGLAVQATAQKLKEYEVRSRIENERKEKDEAALRTIIQGLEGRRVEIAARATPKGGLFKSLGVADIKKALAADIPQSAIELPKPIKEVGERAVTVRAVNAKATITVVVKSA